MSYHNLELLLFPDVFHAQDMKKQVMATGI